MARPRKENLDYFPFDVDFFTDTKIKILKAKYGADGIAVYLYILCEIYHDKGYYVECDEDFILVMSDYFNFSENKTMQILNYLFSRSLLKSILVESVKVITAKSVQRRYQEAKKSAKRDIFVDERIWLLKKEDTEPFIKVYPFDSFSEKNGGYSEKNYNKSEKNSTKESKGKESKGKESKAESVSAVANTRTPSPPYQQIVDLFNQICISFGKVQTLNDKQKKNIRDVIKQFNPDFTEIFKKIEQSDFLTGRNGRWNRCDFDWIINPSNFSKIIRDKYNDKDKGGNTGGYADTGETIVIKAGLNF